MTTRFVKPGEGRRVRVPFSQNELVPEGGMPWPVSDPFLHRRLASGDLVDATPLAPAEAALDDAEPAARRAR